MSLSGYHLFLLLAGVAGGGLAFLMLALGWACWLGGGRLLARTQPRLAAPLGALLPSRGNAGKKAHPERAA